MTLQGYNVIKNGEELNKTVPLAVAKGFCLENNGVRGKDSTTI